MWEHCVNLYFLHSGTFDVQSAAIEVVNGTITISEKFALNSRATGCFIVTSCNVGINKFMAVPINDGAGTVSGLEPGICAVLVYDLERNGKPGIRPAAEIETIQVNGSSEGTYIICTIMCLHAYIEEFITFCWYVHIIIVVLYNIIHNYIYQFLVCRHCTSR